MAPGLISIPRAGYSFFLLVLTFQFLPAMYIVANPEFVPVIQLHSQSDFRATALVFFGIVGVYLLIFSILYLAFTKGKGYSWVSFSVKTNSSKSNPGNDTIFHVFWIVSLFLIIVYASSGGIEKILLLGSDISSREFRFLGFDNIPRVYTALLQISRRFLLPIAILYFLLKQRLNFPVSKILLCALISLQLFASALTMSRAPFLTLFVVIAIPYILTSQSKLKLFLIFSIGTLCLIYVAAFLTMIQYNITDFSVRDLFGIGMDFIFNRMWVVPAVTPINLSFSIFDFWSEKLWLEFSRLSVLWGGTAVGTQMANSIFVTPVGFIGDIWRNFGMLGVILHSFFSALYFFYVDKLMRRSGPFGASIIFFMTVALILYWLMGVFFSQGAFLIMFLLLFIARFFLRPGI